jgi:hypothetical protein
MQNILCLSPQIQNEQKGIAHTSSYETDIDHVAMETNLNVAL